MDDYISFILQFLVMYDHLNKLHPSIIEVLNSLLDPRVFTVDRGQLHILLHHSKRSEQEYWTVKKNIIFSQFVRVLFSC